LQESSSCPSPSSSSLSHRRISRTSSRMSAIAKSVAVSSSREMSRSSATGSPLRNDRVRSRRRAGQVYSRQDLRTLDAARRELARQELASESGQPHNSKQAIFAPTPPPLQEPRRPVPG